MPELQERKILETFRQGKAPAAVKRAASRGTMPVAAGELLEILVLLTQDSDPTCSETARQTLETWPAGKCASLLASPDISAETLDYFAHQPTLPASIAAVLIGHPNTPDSTLATLAGRLPLDQLKLLWESDSRLPQLPATRAALLERPDLLAELRARLESLKPVQPTESEEAASGQDLLTAAEGDETEAEKTMDKRERVSLTQKLARMSVAERVQTALKGNREERLILVRDPAKVVYRAVLQSPKLTDSEVESFATMKNVAEEVLRIIAGSRQFMKNYILVRNLVNNPRTPIDVSLPLLNRLTGQDLKFLTMNRNVPETLRTMAIKLNKQRSSERQGGGGH